MSAFDIFDDELIDLLSAHFWKVMETPARSRDDRMRKVVALENALKTDDLHCPEKVAAVALQMLRQAVKSAKSPLVVSSY